MHIMLVYTVWLVQKNDVSAALQFIATAKAELTAQHMKKTELKSGMDIFNLPQPTYKELAQNEKVPISACPTCMEGTS